MKRKQKSHQSVDSQLVSKHLKQASDVLQSLVTKPNLQQNQKVEDGPALYGHLLAEKHKVIFPELLLFYLPVRLRKVGFPLGGSAYLPHQSFHIPSPCVFSTPPPTANQVYTQPPLISPFQPQQHEGIPHTSKNAVFTSKKTNVTVLQKKSFLDFYSNAEGHVDKDGGQEQP